MNANQPRLAIPRLNHDGGLYDDNDQPGGQPGFRRAKRAAKDRPGRHHGARTPAFLSVALALRREFRGRILSVDFEIAERCAALRVPDPQPEIDALIAATAIVKRLTLVTRNERDFARMPLAIVNPWAAAR